MTTPQAAEPVVTSDKFNASDSDITLISSDNIHFRVHTTNLISASNVFKDMLSIGSSGGNTSKEVTLVESAEVLEIILPYIYPDQVRPYELSISKSLYVVHALHKYEIWRGVEAVKAALLLSPKISWNVAITDRLSKTLRCTVIDGSRISESDVVVGAQDLLRIYTLATLTNDYKMANTVFEALKDSKTDWKDLRDTVISGDTFDSQGAKDLLWLWGTHTLMAADAYTKIAIPSATDSHFKNCYRSSNDKIWELKDLWASLSRVTSVKELERRAIPKILCDRCSHGDCLAEYVRKFKEALETLPPVFALQS